MGEALKKMTDLPAGRLRLPYKGNLCVGADADITIFDYEKLQDKATYEEPALAPEGIEYVIIAGKVAVDHGVVKNRTLGRAVRFTK